MNPLDLITFDTAGFEAQGDREELRVWHGPAGDGVGLYYFSIPPDIEADIDDIDRVRSHYRRMASESGGAIIEVETPTIQKFRCVRTIIKFLQQPSGIAYLGALTLPFRDFSYVFKVQCVELGPGIRDAIIFDQLLRNGALSISEEGRIDGWMEDPYDPSLNAPIMPDPSVRPPLLRNRSEAEEYDAQFPEHPLSRARQALDHIQATMTVAPDLRSAPSFRYPTPQRPPKPWWRR